jgi:hypothetical protein
VVEQGDCPRQDSDGAVLVRRQKRPQRKGGRGRVRSQLAYHPEQQRLAHADVVRLVRVESAHDAAQPRHGVVSRPPCTGSCAMMLCVFARSFGGCPLLAPHGGTVRVCSVRYDMAWSGLAHGILFNLYYFNGGASWAAHGTLVGEPPTRGMIDGLSLDVELQRPKQNGSKSLWEGKSLEFLFICFSFTL